MISFHSVSFFELAMKTLREKKMYRYMIELRDTRRISKMTYEMRILFALLSWNRNADCSNDFKENCQRFSATTCEHETMKKKLSSQIEAQYSRYATQELRLAITTSQLQIRTVISNQKVKRIILDLRISLEHVVCLSRLWIFQQRFDRSSKSVKYCRELSRTRLRMRSRFRCRCLL